MKKNYLKNLLLTVITLLPVAAMQAETIQIGTANDLTTFAQRVNNGEKTLDAVLTADIDLTGIDWTVINEYEGSFDGQNHTIFNYYYYKENDYSAKGGLFGKILENGTVKNLRVAGTIEGKKGEFGTITTYNYGTIKNCKSRVDYNIKPDSNYDYIGGIGGICSYNEGLIEDSEYSGNMNLKGEIGAIGGIVSTNGAWVDNEVEKIGTIRNCKTHCSIVGSYGEYDGYWIGAIVGCNMELEGGSKKGVLENNYYNSNTVSLTINGAKKEIRAVGMEYRDGELIADVPGETAAAAMGYKVGLHGTAGLIISSAEIVSLLSDKDIANAGETVTITIMSRPDYKLDNIYVVKTVNGANADSRRRTPATPTIDTEKVPITLQADGTYTFTMPENNVAVTAFFKQIEPILIFGNSDNDIFLYVYEDNIDDLTEQLTELGILTDGEVTYDPDEGKLTLDNAKIDGAVYVNGNEDDTSVTIEVIGDNEINSDEDFSLMINSNDVTFTGDGTLSVDGEEIGIIIGMQLEGDIIDGDITVVVDGPTIVTTGETMGICIMGNENITLDTEDGVIKAESTGTGSDCYPIFVTTTGEDKTITILPSLDDDPDHQWKDITDEADMGDATQVIVIADGDGNTIKGTSVEIGKAEEPQPEPQPENYYIYIIYPAGGTHGELFVNSYGSKKGTVITVTCIPDEGYQLKSLRVECNNEELPLTTITSTELWETTGYNFTMPEGSVMIYPLFEKRNDQTTAISDKGMVNSEKDAVYTLGGTKANDNRSGVVIINGKKVIKK